MLINSTFFFLEKKESSPPAADASLAACSKLAPQSGAQTVEHAGARLPKARRGEFFIEFFEGHFLTIKRSMNEMSQILLLVQSLMWTKESTTDTKFPRFYSAILFH
jgi:hypothetical protein